VVYRRGNVLLVVLGCRFHNRFDGEVINMGYIRDMYGARTKDFIDGFIAAMDTYAVYRNGIREIGSPEKKLEDAIEEAKRELGCAT